MDFKYVSYYWIYMYKLTVFLISAYNLIADLSEVVLIFFS